jgi:uncharacterized membrane protein
VITAAVGGSRRSTGRAPRHAAVSRRDGIGTLAMALAVIAMLVPLQRLWAAQVLLVPLLLTVPGVILLRALRIPGDVLSSFPAYIPCASIAVIFGSGLIADVIGLLFRSVVPLRATPLLISLEITCLALLATSIRVRPEVAIDWKPLARSARLAWPFTVPLIAAAGALRLNYDRGHEVALMAVVLFVVMLVAAAVLASRLNNTLLKTVLYAATLAVSWSYSLRGDSVYGFDISTEYQRLQETISTGIWHAAHPNDAYGAMLSVTVMPAELHALSGVTGLLVLKVIYPMIFAFFPVAVFDLARKMLSAQWAFVAAAFIVGQYAFTEIVSVARQEIALVIFVALVAAMLETTIPRSSQWALITLLGLAMSFSHYSTTYVAITITGLAIILQWVVSCFRDVPHITGAVAVAFTAALSGAVIWYVPVTHSDSHLLQVAQTVQAQGLDLLPNRPPGSSIVSAYLQGNTDKTVSASQYAQQIHRYYQFYRPQIIPLNDAGSGQYVLRDSAVPEPPVRWRPGDDLLGLSLLLIEQLANVLAALGGLFMVLRKKAPPLARQIGILALVTTLLLTLIRFSGTLAGAYGQERAQLQGLTLLAIAVCWMIQAFAQRWKRWRVYIFAATSASLAVILFNTSYLAAVVLGGAVPTNLANSGPAFEYFDITAPEIASAQWLGNVVEPGQLVYADEYVQLPLAVATTIQEGLLNDVTPLTINQSAWVYASRTNVTNGRAFAIFNGMFASYAFPSVFLDANYNLVYTNGSSEVFHR